MNVVLSTIGKFHTFDLARQMQRRGVLASIYSGYPWMKLRPEGLPRKQVKCFPYLHAPYMRLAPRNNAARLWWEWQDRVWFDWYVSRDLPACDVFCGLSGSALRTGRKAKARGAKYVCDRGSSHIRFQDQIMREEYDRQNIPVIGVDPRIIEREVDEYEEADLIAVPSKFALDTFVSYGVPAKKMRLVPYGVDLRAFYPCAKKDDDRFEVLFVGGISVRKGIAYLLDAFRLIDSSKKHLTLAGSVSPEMETVVAQLRRNPAVTIMGHVAQPRLREVMSRSHVLVLPSVEEGLALVQAQAMACGCPVVASANTGAEDLFADGREGFIVPVRDTDAFVNRLQVLADDSDLRARMSLAALERVKSIGGWDQYGEAMYNVFSEARNL